MVGTPRQNAILCSSGCLQAFPTPQGIELVYASWDGMYTTLIPQKKDWIEI